MVDVGFKVSQLRRAVATGEIRCAPATIKLLRQGRTPKGTANLIPLCHPLPLSSVHLELTPKPDRILITAEVRVHARTGVEMEALTAVSVAALTLYDMLKAVDRKMVIQNIRLIAKEKI